MRAALEAGISSPRVDWPGARFRSAFLVKLKTAEKVGPVGEGRPGEAKALVTLLLDKNS